MPQLNFFAMLALSISIGLLSAYLAAKRDKNPYVWFFIGIFCGLLGVITMFFAFPKKQKKKSPTVQEPVFEEILIGPSDKFWYYLDVSHVQKGPMSFSALSKAWKQGTITPQTFVWQEEFPDWKPLQECIQKRRINPNASIKININ